MLCVGKVEVFLLLIKVYNDCLLKIKCHSVLGLLIYAFHNIYQVFCSHFFLLLFGI